MDWPISSQKVKDNAGGGSGSGLPVLDLTATPFSSFVEGPSEIELTRDAIDALCGMRGHGPIIVKYKPSAETPDGVYLQIILTEAFGVLVSVYSGMGVISDGLTVPVIMVIAPEDLDSAYEGKWTATLGSF